MEFRRVAGVCSSRSRGSGPSGTNRIEAEEVAKAVAEHARSRPDLSLGVVVFSKAQADMLTSFFQLTHFRFRGIKSVNGKTRRRDPKLGRTRQLSFQIIAQQCRRVIDNSQEIPQVTRKPIPHTLP